MFELFGNDKNPQIGTEILDLTLPSDINFEENNKKEL